MFSLIRTVVVFSCAITASLVPARPVWAQADASAAGDEQTEGQRMLPDPEEPMPPMPAGVPAAEAPRVEGDGEEEQEQDDPAVSAGAAAAGTGAMRPFGGLFRGATRGTRDKHRLDLSASVFAIRAEGDRSGLRGGTDLFRDGASTYGGASVGLDYETRWDEASVGAFGDFSPAYIPARKDSGLDPWIDRWSAGGDAAFSRQLGRRMRVRGSGHVDYSPYFQQELLFQPTLPTILPPSVGTPGLDFALARDPSVRSVLSGTVSYSRSSRTTLDGFASFARRDFISSDTSSYHDQLVGGRYTYRLNSWMGIRAGYGYRTASYGGPDAEPIHSHDIDVGADGGYGRSFALTRRTTFSFATGTSLFLRERFQENGNTGNEDNGSGETRLFVNGTADLVHGWGQTWAANVGVRRSINYELGFREPLLSNGVYAAVGGLLASRLDFTTTGTYASGSVGFGSGENGFATSAVTSALRLTLSRWLAAYAQYFYYHYDFESGVTLPGFLRRGLDRRGVSVGLTTSVPLIGSRGRR